MRSFILALCVVFGCLVNVSYGISLVGISLEEDGASTPEYTPVLCEEDYGHFRVSIDSNVTRRVRALCEQAGPNPGSSYVVLAGDAIDAMNPEGIGWFILFESGYGMAATAVSANEELESVTTCQLSTKFSYDPLDFQQGPVLQDEEDPYIIVYPGNKVEVLWVITTIYGDWMEDEDYCFKFTVGGGFDEWGVLIPLGELMPSISIAPIGDLP